MISLLLSGALGALWNRIRGGFIEEMPNRRTLNALMFGLLAFALSGDPYLILAGFVGMFAGQSLGWGRYIGALGGWERKELKEVDFIDNLIKDFKPEVTTKLPDGSLLHLPYSELVRWGFLGLALRGFVWSLAIGLAFALAGYPEALLGALVGLAMPICYKIPQEILEHLGKKDKLMWEYGEVVFGFILWAGTLFFLTNG